MSTVEGTYNVNSQVEIGAGVGLISNKAKAFEAKKSLKTADQPVLKNVTLGSYNSIHTVYATAKLNIYDQEGIRPYVKVWDITAYWIYWNYWNR